MVYLGTQRKKGWGHLSHTERKKKERDANAENSLSRGKGKSGEAGLRLPAGGRKEGERERRKEKRCKSDASGPDGLCGSPLKPPKKKKPHARRVPLLRRRKPGQGPEVCPGACSQPEKFSTETI